MMSNITPEQASDIRRVVIVLSPPAGNLEKMQGTVEIALRLKAEMHVLFIEDINLLRLAALPRAGELSYGAGGIRPLDRERMERVLKAQANAVREKLSALAARHKVPWSFQVRRGHVSREVLASVVGEDLLILDRVRESLVSSTGEEGILWRILRQTTSTVLLQRDAGHAPRALTVYFDGTPAAWRALRLATSCFQEGSLPMTIVLPPMEEAEERRARAHIEEYLGAQGIPCRIHRLRESTCGCLARMLAEQGCGLFIGGRPGLMEYGESLLRDLEGLGCGCLLVN